MRCAAQNTHLELHTRRVAREQGHLVLHGTEVCFHRATLKRVRNVEAAARAVRPSRDTGAARRILVARRAVVTGPGTAAPFRPEDVARREERANLLAVHAAAKLPSG